MFLILVDFGNKEKVMSIFFPLTFSLAIFIELERGDRSYVAIAVTKILLIGTKSLTKTGEVAYATTLYH